MLMHKKKGKWLWKRRNQGYLHTAQRAWTLGGNCMVVLESGTKKNELWQGEDGNTERTACLAEGKHADLCIGICICNYLHHRENRARTVRKVS